jgi:hypothetical protein
MRPIVAILVLAPRMSTADPVQLPKECVADSPVDEPCRSFRGTYHLEILPPANEPACVITKPIKTDFVLGKPLPNNEVQIDGRALVAKLGWKQRPSDYTQAAAALDTGVCCIQLIVTETVEKPRGVERRLVVDIARGRTKAIALGHDRVLHDRGGGDCQADLRVDVRMK